MTPRIILERATDGPAAWGYAEIVAGIVRHYDPRSSTDARFQVLEAGGGSDCWLPLPPGAEITTIDISQDQLDMNTYATEKLRGDLQTFDYGARRFDLVVCWDVLEHLEQPEAALMRLAKVLKPGGRLVLKGPIPATIKGLVTQFTPHWLHVIFYRRVLGSVQAGLPGHPPFKAHMNSAAGPLEAAALLTREGLVVDTLRGYESQHVAAIAAKSRIMLGAYRIAERMLEMVTGGHYQRGMTDFFLIARR